MANSLQLGFPVVPKSITNPSVKRQDALDVNGPMPFLTFIKILNVSFEASSLQEYYNHYLKDWNTKNTAKPVDEHALVVEQYRDFIKEVNLNYSTPEERDFISKVDFDDPLDLDIILGFYSRKLKEIAFYYNSKRHDVKFNTTRSKLKGTKFGTEKTLTEVILSYLKSLDDGKMLYDYDTIKSKLEIEVEELYNTYPLSFNQTPNDRIYDNKDLDYGLNIFLKSNEELVSEVFAGMSEDLKSIKEVDSLYDSKRALTEKYMAFPMYYIETGSTITDVISGKLFENVNTSGNFLNRNFPTTASTEHAEYLQTPREKGFFRPSNTTIVLVDGLNHSFSINYDNLAPNSLYVFPDPTILGTNGAVLTFTVDDSYLKRNFSSGVASNHPKSDPYDTKYYGYVSKIEPSTQKYLDSVFEQGYVKDSKRDVYGNLYGLFKTDSRFEKTISFTTTPTITSVLFNGGWFFDNIYNTGYTYDYDVEDTTLRETLRSGLSTNTYGFSAFLPDLLLNFGSFSNNKPLKEHSIDTELTVSYQIYENGFIMNDAEFYADPVSSDLSAFEVSSSNFYFSQLIENGVNDDVPLQRALLDPLYPSLTGTLLTYGNSLTSFYEIDGGRFEVPFPSQSLYSDEYFYDSTVLHATQLDTSTQTIYEGALLVRNTYTKQVLPLLSAVSFLNNKYSATILDEINTKVNKFEVAMDVLFVETDNWLTISKVGFESGEFTDPKTPTYSLEHSTGNFDKVSNRVKWGFDVFFCKMITTEPISSNNFILYPEIYRYNTTTLKTTKLYPAPLPDTTFFTVSGGNTRYTSADSPILNYDSKTNSFILAVALRNQNDMISIHNYPFYLSPNVIFDEHTIITMTPYEYSNIFGNTTVNFYLSSAAYSVINEELIL